MLQIVIAAACWVAISLPSVAQPVTLKFSFFTSDQDVNWVRVLKPFIDAVNSDPKGAVKIDPFPNGALGRNLPQQPQMVLDGIADIAFIVPSLSSGRFPDDTLFEIPGVISNLAEGTRLGEALIASNSLRGYSDYVVLAYFINPPVNIYSRRPIKTITDLKGMKVRILGPIVGQTVKELGMIPVLMPPNEIVEAIGRGTIDAVTTTTTALFDFGIDRVASHDYFIQLGTISFAVVMNRSKFEIVAQAGSGCLDETFRPRAWRTLYKTDRASSGRIDKSLEIGSKTNGGFSVRCGHGNRPADLHQCGQGMGRQGPAQ